MENVVGRTSLQTSEIIIWDNGSVDGTNEYLSMLSDSRIRVVSSTGNVGMVAYGRAIAMTRAPFIIQLDDDVIDAPDAWDAQLLEAFLAVPRLAWLAADLQDNPSDRASYDRHNKDQYVERVINGVPFLDGPAGGWCTITSREIYDAVGGLPQSSRHVYFSTDSIYVKKVRAAGYETGILGSLRVLHRGDRAGERPAAEKERFHRREAVIQRRRNLIKRALLLIPGVRASNQRRGWFHEPDK